MKHPISLIALAALLPISAFAATDGTPGDTSTGSLTFTLTINEPPPQIQVTGLQDIVLDTTVGTNPGSGSSNVCVYMSEPGTYRADVTVTPLVINQTAVPYTFSFEDQSQGGPLLSGVVSNNPISLFNTGFAPSSVENCTTGAIPAIFEATISQAPTEAGSGTATFTLTVTPD